MSSTHQANREDGGHVQVLIETFPDECPVCHRKGTFSPLQLHHNSNVSTAGRLEILFKCPNSNCYELFIGYFSEISGFFIFVDAKPVQYIAQNFSKIIEKISPDFSTIFNQSLKAENDGLNQVCGPGYRKALEFLVKDYLVGKATEAADKEMIKKEALGLCISTRIQDMNIKEVAKRAVWLGNDETHYIRKWGEKDLQDLKNLIKLCVHWMEAEALTTELLKDMPDSA